MDNNNQPNINIPEQPPINSIPPSPKKLRKIIIVVGALVLAVTAIIYIIPKYWDVAGGGATIQTSPDSIKAGEAATIKFEVSVPGSQQNINGRYTDIVMHYNLTEFDSNFIQPKLISQTQDKEIYEFTIPPYPGGTQGEISYYIELKLDGHANRIEGYKKIKVGESIASTNNSSFKTWDDGTGYLKGKVIEHISGCEVDGACKLIVQTGDQKVALVYAEEDMQCLNTQAASWVNWGKNVNKGTVIKAYGAYKRLGNEQRLTFCDSKDYFILNENDPVPVGSYTEKTLKTFGLDESMFENLETNALTVFFSDGTTGPQAKEILTSYKLNSSALDNMLENNYTSWLTNAWIHVPDSIETAKAIAEKVKSLKEVYSGEAHQLDTLIQSMQPKREKYYVQIEFIDGIGQNEARDVLNKINQSRLSTVPNSPMISEVSSRTEIFEPRKDINIGIENLTSKKAYSVCQQLLANEKVIGCSPQPLVN